MIDRKMHDRRASELYSQMHSRYNALGRKMSKQLSITIPKAPLPFTREEFKEWCWSFCGRQAFHCPYCRTPIDILCVSVDHVRPLSRGGSWDLDNLRMICKPCNLRKGAFTGEEYRFLLDAVAGAENVYLRAELLKRLEDAANGSRERFFRNKGKKATA